MFEEELVNTLKANGFAQTKTRTLQEVYDNTSQDGQYNSVAFQNARILQKYLDKYAKLTVDNILNPK